MNKKKTKNLVLDSWSLLAYFKEEKAGFKVKELLHQAAKNQINLHLNLLNWGEIYYQILRRFGKERLRKIITVIEQSPIKLMPVDKELVILASEQKAKGGLSFADCFVLATAKRLKGLIVTGDPEFKVLEKEVEILWLKR